MFGFTANYIKVALEHDASLVNQLVPVQLGNIDLEAEELQVNATRTSPVQS
jgi:hypothetical protein